MAQIKKKWLKGVGQASGLAELDASGFVPLAQLPASVTGEAALREAGDANLQTQVNLLIAGGTQEIADRQTGDAAALSDAKAYTDQKVVDLKGGASSSYDTLKKIEDKIEFIVSNVDGAALDSLSEIVSAFQTADGTLNGAIQQLASAGEQAMLGEIAMREAADSALDARLDVLEADPVTKSYVDAQIPDNTDGLAEGSVKLYFTDARAKAAAVVNSMAGSQADQAPSVAALKTYLDAFASSTLVKEKYTIASGDISAGYIDLGHLALANSIHAYVNRVAIHEVDDYALSVVGGKTRLTFAGEIAFGGVSQLEVGDVIRVSYQYK